MLKRAFRTFFGQKDKKELVFYGISSEEDVYFNNDGSCDENNCLYECLKREIFIRRRE